MRATHITIAGELECPGEGCLECARSQSHYEIAEALLAEGERVVSAIAAVGAPFDRIEIEQRRDALGKKAMGIWAQAQAHATLALADMQLFIAENRQTPVRPT